MLAAKKMWTLEAAVSRLSAGQMVALFTFVNILNYLDRGIVPGAFDSIGAWIREDMQTQEVRTMIGVLQSMYIVGYATASVTFGHLVHSYPPFKLMSVGLAIWLLAVFMSGAAPHFWVLVVARMLSGVGEASFQTVVPPFIDDNSPPSKRGLWLSIFFMAIPVGTAFGYAWGGNIATTMSWRWAFYIEGIPMLPLIFLIWYMPYTKSKREALAKLGSTAASTANAVDDSTSEKEELLLGADGLAPIDVTSDHHATRLASLPEADSDDSLENAPLRQQQQQQLVNGLVSPGATATPAVLEDGVGVDDAALRDTVSGASKPTFLQELAHVLTEPLFVSVILGYAGYTAVFAGVGAFGPALVEGLGIFPDQATASFYFGGAVAFAGAIGTPLGGWLLDKETKKKRRKEKRKAALAAAAAAALGPAATADEILAFSAQAALDNPGRFSPTPARGKIASLINNTKAAVQPVLQPVFDMVWKGGRRVSGGSGGEGSDMWPRAAGGDADSSGAAEHGAYVAVASTERQADAADNNSNDQVKAAVEGVDSDEETDEEAENSTDPATIDLKLNIALPQAVWMMVIGTVCLIAGVMLGAANAPLFFGLLSIGALVCCATTAGINQSIMASVKPDSRSFAIGLGTLLLHALGDVPAPTIIGMLADQLAPQTCTTDPETGEQHCTQSAYGLQVTIVICCSWLVWPILLWCVAWAIAHRRQAQHRAVGYDNVVRLRDMQAASGTHNSHLASSLRGGNQPDKFSNSVTFVSRSGASGGSGGQQHAAHRDGRGTG